MNQESGQEEKFYFAPLEGINGYVYRNAYHRYFGEIDKYFTPFLKPNQFGRFSSREKNDILPEHNVGMNTVPQILTNSAEDFVRTARKLKEYGYEEVNLNLGCPSRTVVTKKRGSGFLAFPEELDYFLEEIFSGVDVQISIKTRIGKESPDEFSHLLEIFRKYPLSELIVHPRVQTDFYKNTPNWEVFRLALANGNRNICYNGDIFSVEDYERFRAAFPEVKCVMLGRGILANPGLICMLKGKGVPAKETLRAFHEQIYTDYQAILSGERDVLFKMKELWQNMAPLFTNYEKYAKMIRKATRLMAYERAVEELFAGEDLKLLQFTP